jgi:hypothetical protein
MLRRKADAEARTSIATVLKGPDRNLSTGDMFAMAKPPKLMHLIAMTQVAMAERWPGCGTSKAGTSRRRRAAYLRIEMHSSQGQVPTKAY